jgi:hypothetical protein
MDAAKLNTRNSSGGIAGFFGSRWRCEVPLQTLFWRDMAVVGTLINLATTGLAVALLAMKMPLGVWASIHFLPMPYNLFLVIAVWRTAETQRGTAFVQAGAAFWLLLATLF